jgi:hypothetical protein
MIESIYSKPNDLTTFQILQFDEMITILKQVVLESVKNN